MMKLKTLAIMIAATTAAFTACTENDSQQQQMMPITLTSQIATTRSFTPTQENHLVSGQKLYVWANREATEGTANWTQNAYLKAWTLTADGSGALTGSTKYYPPQTLSMVALHGNFSFTEDTDVFPGTVQHSVLTDQSTEENYAKSDLLYWKALGQSAEASKAVTLGHKLSKIEIHLSGNGYTEDDIDQMELTLNNVLPTASLDLTDGTLSQAYGTAVSIKPYKTNKVDYEAIIPPQQKPLDFITVTLNGTVVKIDAQVTGFDENTRYPYNLDMTYRDIRKNPLWYVAEYNVNYDGSSTYSWATTPDEGYYFTYNDAVTAASKFSGWHLPHVYEWNSISPAIVSLAPLVRIPIEEICADVGGEAIKNDGTSVRFGYNEETSSTLREKSYWYRKSNNVWYAIRYCDSEFCSAWKYEFSCENPADITVPVELTISATLLGQRMSISEAQTLYGKDNEKWASIYFGNNELIGAVQRKFISLGYRIGVGSGSSATDGQGRLGGHWSTTTINGGYSRLHFAFDNAPASGAYFRISDYNNVSTNAYPIRLIKDTNIRPILPMDYVAETNMYSASTFASNNNTNSSYFFAWATANSYYNTTNGTQRNLIGQSCTGRGYSKWHLPTFPEASAVIPPPSLTAGTARVQFNATSLLNSGITERLEWGWNGTSYNVSKNFYAEYKNVNSTYAYAVRYKESDSPKGGYGNYTTAFRYELKSNYPSSGNQSLVIRWKWLGANSTDILSNSSDDVIGNETYWANYDGECVIPRVGYYSSGNAAAGTSPSGSNGHYWTSTVRPSDTSYAHIFYFNDNTVGDTGTTYYSTRSKQYGFTVRLFADAQ